MVNKKTSDNDVKKISTAENTKTAKKSSKTVKATKPEIKKATEKKVVPATVKKTSKATSAVKTTKKVSENVPSVENHDVVASVLEVKAKNEAKKAAKTVKVKAAVVNSGASAGENKGENAAQLRNKRGALKENVQKAEAKKFMSLKEETALEPESCCNKCCCFSGLKTFFVAWLDGYRKIFNYKSRTNRYDFWAFMLLNLVIVTLISLPYHLADIAAYASGQKLPLIIDCLYWGFSFFIMLAYLALYVRRLHDAGYDAWKGFFRPMTYSILGIVVLAIVGHLFLSPDDNNGVAALLGGSIVILLLVNLYYLCKTFIASGFMEEEAEENAYGAAKLLKACGKRKFLRYATLYLIISIFYMILILSVQYYFSIMLLSGAGIY